MYVNKSRASYIGGLAIAVPGEMGCYAHLHDKYGKADWNDLIQIIINFIENHFFITNTQSGYYSICSTTVPGTLTLR